MELLGELAVMKRHLDPNIPPAVNSNKKNTQTTADGRFEGRERGVESCDEAADGA
jgi:hypothetical protein